MSGRRVVGTFLSIGSALSLVCLLSVVSVIYRNPAESCYHYSPAPTGSAMSEAIFPEGEFSWVPLGLRCTFPASSGGGITVGPDYALTWIALGLSALLVVGLMLLITTTRWGNRAMTPLEMDSNEKKIGL